MRPTLIVLLAALLPASGIEPPRAGIAVRAGCVHRITGVPGAFLTGLAEVCGVKAAASWTGFAAKTEQALLLDGEERTAPPGAAAIGFDAGGRAARVWYAAEGAVFDLPSGRKLFPVEGEVRALAALGEETALVVESGGRLRLERRAPDGAPLSDGPLEGEYAVLLPGGIPVTAAGKEVRLPGGQTVALPEAVESLHLMGENWIMAGMWAIHTVSGDFYRLPEPRP